MSQKTFPDEYGIRKSIISSTINAEDSEILDLKKNTI